MANIIFDFDGTIADTFDIGVSVFNEVSGKPKLTPAKIEELRGLSAREAIKHLEIHWWELPYLAFKISSAMDVRMASGNVHSFAGIKEALDTLRSKDQKLFIVSSNSHKNIVRFLGDNKLTGYFEKIYGGIGVFSKAATLQKVVLTSRLKMAKTVYVGDEVRDIEAARKAGTRSLSVTWGYNNRTALEAAGARVLVDSPRDLPNALLKLMNEL
jgi:phosphoglycolate phosphatase